jgi:hypothetical protein
MIYWGLIVLAAIALVLYVREKIRAYSLKAVFIKSVVSVLFIVVGVLGMAVSAVNPTLMGPFVVLGLVCGLLGDIWLDLKYVYKQHQHIYTYAGFMCFIMGHIFFIPAIFSEYAEMKWWYIPATLLASVIFMVCTLALEKPMGLKYGRFKPITGVYAVFLSTTMFAAINGVLLCGANKEFITLIAGSVLFTLSDLVLSNIYFKEGGNTKVNVLVNHILYYAAQFTFASTLLMD